MDVRETYERATQAVTLYAEWPLRIVFAAVFLYHGIDKFASGIEGFANAVDVSVGLAGLAAAMEVAAGVFVLVGGFTFPFHAWFTRVGAVAAIPVMVAAIAKVHWPRWAFTPAEGFPLGGMEFQVTLILVSLYFLTSTGRLTEHQRLRTMPLEADGDLRVRRTVQNLPQQAHWFLRIAMAAVFLYHGFTKFGTLEEFGAAMGISTATGFVVALVECAAGLLFLIGGARTVFADAASRIGGLLVIPVMLGAIIKVHGGRWAFSPADGFPLGGAEFQTLLIAIALFFVLRGRPALGPITERRTTGV